MQHGDMVKYTAVLPAGTVNALKRMAERKEIPSVNQGIREALERYITDEEKARYAREMREAAADADYMARTMETQEAFAGVDAEEMGGW